MDDAKTVWCGNLSDQVTEELLFELFLQAAPLERVRIPTDREGRKSNFAFITFKHEVSVNYALQLLNGTRLYDKPINVKPRNSNSQNQVGDRYTQHNDYQKHSNQNLSYNDVLKTGQMQHHNYDNMHMNNYDNMHMNNYDNRQGRWEHNYRDNYRDREDMHRDHHKSYKKHDYKDNRQNDSPNRRRNNYGDRRNFDRNNRRNNRNYY